MQVEEIIIAETAGGEMVAQQSAELVAGQGIVGDRYFSSQGTFSDLLLESQDFEVTLIEQEEIEAFNEAAGLDYSASDFRRNIVTRGVRLNDLEGREFSVGEVRLRGVRLCEPCGYLAGRIGKVVLKHMMHKAGLRAQIITGGFISQGDAISVN
ncbi:MOSC domain-containing protein [Teredinibacter waterburyi]|jgi:Uncharacterized protein conserved in bacteria|uniref:MOSC domain-containing protein n=1 Tax=Teredinibacter waterburyi TaxID=1500538 RepID=UPI00165FCE1F|nr:MOSC domain-containing protein [Teredinibacter waterburyi]